MDPGRYRIRPKMLDPDEMNADPQPWYKDGWRQEVYSNRRTALHLKQFVWDRLSGQEQGSAAQPDGVSQIKKVIVKANI